MATLTVDDLTIELDPRRTRHMEPLKAWSAMQKLLEDKEDTKQAFEIARALSGRSLEKDFVKMVSSKSGRAEYEKRRELIPTLSDSEYLRSLSEDSFGRAYLNFIETENISAKGLEAEGMKAEGGDEELHDDLSWYGRRQRDTHDLLHVLTGYGRDGLGEACVLAFTYSQSKNFGLIFMAYMGGRSMSKEAGDKRYLKCVWEAKRLGKEAHHISSADLEHLLTQPLDQVRRDLNIQRPDLYIESRPEYLRLYEAYQASMAEPATA